VNRWTIVSVSWNYKNQIEQSEMLLAFNRLKCVHLFFSNNNSLTTKTNESFSRGWTNPCNVLHIYHPFNGEYFHPNYTIGVFALLTHCTVCSTFRIKGVYGYGLLTPLSTISVISRRSVLLVEKTAVHGENHQAVASY